MPSRALVLVHGALFTPDQLEPLCARLRANRTCCLPVLSGHAGLPIPAGGFSMADFRKKVLSDLDQCGIQTAHFFGYSLGGYVALDLALHAPERVASVTTLGTILDWSPEKAQQERRLLNPEAMRQKIPAFTEQLRSYHDPVQWESVVTALADFMLDLGNQPAVSKEELSRLNQPIHFFNGENDSSARPEVSAAWAREIPCATFHLVEKAGHPFHTCPIDPIETHLRELD